LENAIGTLTQQIPCKRSNLDRVIERSDADPEFSSAIGRVCAGIAADTQRATEMQQELSGIRGSRSTTDVGTIIHRLRDDARSNDPTVRQPARLQIAEALHPITDEMLVDVTEDKAGFLIVPAVYVVYPGTNAGSYPANRKPAEGVKGVAGRPSSREAHGQCFIPVRG
jgi:hypothetical protein